MHAVPPPGADGARRPEARHAASQGPHRQTISLFRERKDGGVRTHPSETRELKKSLIIWPCPMQPSGALGHNGEQ